MYDMWKSKNAQKVLIKTEEHNQQVFSSLKM